MWPKRTYFSVDEKAKNYQLSLTGCIVDIYTADVWSKVKSIAADDTGGKHRFYRRKRDGDHGRARLTHFSPWKVGL